MITGYYPIQASHAAGSIVIFVDVLDMLALPSGKAE
jgi:hypothetical protein